MLPARLDSVAFVEHELLTSLFNAMFHCVSISQVLKIRLFL